MAVRPLKDGVIADFDVTERMLRYFIQKVHRRSHLAKPRMVVAVPSGITGVEQSAVKEAGHQAGARRVYIIEEPMAAAIGAGLPVNEPTGNMVVDIGGGTTEVAVISLGGIVTSQSIRIGGDELDQAIITFGKKEYSLMLGERTAEEIKMALGSAYPSADEPHAEIRGRDLVSGLPKTIVISAEEIRRAIEEPLALIVDAVKTTLDKCPPELAGDVMDRGIALTGGGALLRGLDERLREETGMPIHMADNPLDSVVLGTGKCVEDFDTLRQVLVPESQALTAAVRRPAAAAAWMRRPGARQSADPPDSWRAAGRGPGTDHVRLVGRRRRRRRPVAGLRGVGGTVFGSAESLVGAVTRPVAAFFGNVTGAPASQQQIAGLQREVVRLRTELSQAQLSKAAGGPAAAPAALAGRGGYRIVAANVIAAGPGYNSSVTIDAGRDDGIKPDETVLNGAGPGRHGHLGEPRAHRTVLLTTDASSTVGVRLAGTGQIGAVTGTGRSRPGPALLRLQVFDASAVLQPGQQLVTFGSVHGRPYVPGVPVGVITAGAGERDLADQDRPGPALRRRQRPRCGGGRDRPAPDEPA